MTSPVVAVAFVPEDSGALADQILLRRMSARDESAVALLYDRHGRAVYTLAKGIVRDPALAQEVVQDVFLRCWQEAEVYDPARGRVASWILRMTRNKSIDLLRTRSSQARQRESSGVLDESAPDAPEALPHPEGVVLREWVGGALEALPAAQRKAIELAYFGGLTQTEIAAKLGEPLGTVKTRMRLGLERLRELLDPSSKARAAGEGSRG